MVIYFQINYEKELWNHEDFFETVVAVFNLLKKHIIHI